MNTPAVWLLPSHSRPDVVHRVTLAADGLLTCTCTAAHFGRMCRHRLAVIHDHLQEMTMSNFNPADHLIKLQNKDYLEVKWRLVWLREVHPDATIITEILNHNPAEEWAVIRATVVIPGGGGSATGMALQRPTSIAKDYIANGETSAIGRALGALGFGTQFAPEFDQGELVVDSPVARRPATSGAAKPEQVAWYGQSMKRYGFTTYLDQLAIAEDIGRAPFDHLTANQLKGIVEAARATLVVKGDDGRWAIAEPVLEQPTIAVELSTAMR